jgi:hypothetical protein
MKNHSPENEQLRSLDHPASRRRRYLQSGITVASQPVLGTLAGRRLHYDEAGNFWAALSRPAL